MKLFIAILSILIISIQAQGTCYSDRVFVTGYIDGNPEISSGTLALNTADYNLVVPIETTPITFTPTAFHGAAVLPPSRGSINYVAYQKSDAPGRYFLGIIDILRKYI